MTLSLVLRSCLFVAGASLSLPVAAHGSAAGADAVRLLAWQAEGWIAVSVVMMAVMLLARFAASSKPLAAWGALLSVLALTSLAAVLWQVDRWVLGGLVAGIWLYAVGLHRLWGAAHFGAGIPAGCAACYFAGMALLVVALMSPVDAIGEHLFSMHMVQHELMMLVAAPLIVAGNPLTACIWAFSPPARVRIGRLLHSRSLRWLRQLWHLLTQALAAWLLHALVLWAWHFPTLFSASLADDGVHTLQHISFLGSALLFWAALLGPHARLRANRQGLAAVYVLTTAIHTGALGALLTFSPRAWYPDYAGRTEDWGLTLLEDQQLGGLIMWVPAGFLLLAAGLWLAARMLAPRGNGLRDWQPAGR
ncbi:MAG TPA: cytochrome c oxidase assembly protein [Oxalobacteraceae bacterium]|nr:cytochrome c oxidase assembly protein [Oxalobacteraceae bacterium]